ncbi:MAG: hypothetical protein IMW93_02575 [Thermoanaerobacteraceae bacterium]|nr:hypothetical protein [Thermoanaerobacteraceae bacterium]
MAVKKMTRYLVLTVVVVPAILMGLFFRSNIDHTHTQDSLQSESKITEAIAVVEQYNLMKQEAAEIPGILVKKADWEKVVSRRVMNHYNHWRRGIGETYKLKELTANILQTTEIPHLQEMAETAGYFLNGAYTWRNEYAGFEIINAQETGLGVDVCVREYIITRHVEGDGGLGWGDQVYTIVWERGPTGKKGAFIDRQKVNVRKGVVKRWSDKMPDKDEIRRMVEDLKKQVVDHR